MLLKRDFRNSRTETHNQILGRLKAAEYRRLSRYLEDVPLDFKQTLYKPDGPVKAAYFVEAGVISLVTLLDDGTMAETGTIGNEGMAGLATFLGIGRSSEQAICQLAGHAKRLSGEHLRAERRQAVNWPRFSSATPARS